jgi:hypothetical protein
MGGKSYTLDLTIGADNPLYAGCEIEEAPNGYRLKQYPAEIANVVGHNAEAIVRRLVADGVERITLTGRSAIWAYLVVFHNVVHRFREVYYDDGKPNGAVRIAAH